MFRSSLLKLKSVVWFLCLATLFSLSLRAYSAEESFHCDKSSVIFSILMKSGYAMFATAAVKKGFAIVLFLDEYGNFSVVGVDKDINSCVILSGSDWKFVLVHRI